MRNKTASLVFLIFPFFVSVTFESFGQLGTKEPWTESQLLEPIMLANIINTPNAKQPIIYSIGPGAIIKGSIDIGPAKEKVSLQKLRVELSKLLEIPPNVTTPFRFKVTT